VKRVLTECARLTTDIMPSGISIRLKSYQDSSILYGTRVFTERFDRLPDIRAEFMTHVWYAARRAGITIPYPIRTVYRTEVPPTPAIDPLVERKDMLGKVPLFSTLSGEEMGQLAESSSFVEFASGEPIISQGELGQTMFIVRRGRAAVSVRSPESSESRTVAEVGPGDFFGEFAILTGEPRHASVVAIEDVELVAVSKVALQGILERRPKLVEEIVAVIEARKHGLKAAKELRSLPAAEQQQVARESSALLGSIKRFFRLGE
jgi:CRP-like cAMP-binding protein